MKNYDNGYAGKLLSIDLTNNSIVTEEIDEDTVDLYVGGVGYGSKIIWDELKPATDPLGPDNLFIATTGPLTGTFCPGSDSWIACFKSPLTNIWGESRSGGGFGPELKRAGYDHLVLKGSADKPVYILIDEQGVTIRQADHLWGKLAHETETIIRNELGHQDLSIITIGPAGENKVRFASIITNSRGLAGRCGGGAVLGSKKVKAIAVKGYKGVKIAQPEVLKALITEIEEDQARVPAVENFKKGTASFTAMFDETGEIPTKYGQSNSWGKADMYKKLEKYFFHGQACESCTMNCRVESKVSSGEWTTPLTHGPEYETVAQFSNMVLNDNPEFVIHANYLCNNYGLDTISCGNLIAFAMECYENGWINKEDLGGLDLRWGNCDAIACLIKQIANKEGFGQILSEGIITAAKKIGREAEKIAMHVKGLDNPAHDPRGNRTGKIWLLQYGTASRGMCHIHPQEPVLLGSYYHHFGYNKKDWPGIDEPYSIKGKAEIVRWTQDYGMAAEIFGLCKFHQFTAPAISPYRYALMFEAVTGKNMNESEMFHISERIFTLQRCISIREGINRSHDMVPKRFCERPRFGPFANNFDTETSDYELMLDEYYNLREWDHSTGKPSKDKLERLGIGYVIDKISL